MRLLQAISSHALWTLATVAAYETWHLIDQAAVICQKPADAPQYSVGINYTSELIVDQPHIISIIRKSSKAMTVGFKVLDADGTEVVEDTTIQLGELSDTVPSTCKCEAPAASIHEPIRQEYGASYGLSCDAWDNANCAKWWGNEIVGEWCCSKWCYASKECPDAYQSALLTGTYYSYKACKSSPAIPSSSCSWTTVAKSKDPCECKKDKASLFSDAMKAAELQDFGYGSSCKPWDSRLNTCETFYRPDQVDTWCCANWCYVEKACPSAIKSVNAGLKGELFWSDNVCIDDAKLITQCKYKPEPNNTANTETACQCLNETMPSVIMDQFPVGTPADYGKVCAPHDAELCDKIYPAATPEMWCCMSWCWVDKSCPGAAESTRWPGHYRSESGCTMDADIVSGCPFSSACECSRSPGKTLLESTYQTKMSAQAGSTVTATFASDYGSSCKAWDATNCKSVWGNNPNSGWENSSHDWCCDSWCYVNESCPIAKKSWLVDDLGYYFSYETCDDGPETYRNETDTCTARRLRASDSFADDQETSSAAPRQLAGRRRGGGSRRGGSSGSSGSSWSSGSRRRQSPPAPPANSRRRQYSRPSAPSPRRRAPPPPVRRRAPPPPVESNHRRRQQDISGTTYSAQRRRASSSSVSSSTPRRRSSYDGNYGYTNRPQMMNNYGNQMPYQTSYGYSGYNAYPAKSQSNVALYAGGGLLAGAFVGYAAASYFNSNSKYNRYNSLGYPDRYCIVPQGVSYFSWDGPGDMIECRTCYRRYDYCLYADDCQRSSGCGFSAPQSFNRDDFAATGFIPKDYTPPLSVIITKLEGPDISADPMKGVCPPVTEVQKAAWQRDNLTQRIPLDLFVVLTRQEKLDTPDGGVGGAMSTSGTLGLLPILVLLMALLRK